MHTPGPWECRKSRQEGMYQVICGNFYVQGLIGEANARLIAAAPALLEALEEVLEIDEFPRDTWHKCMRAVAAARGDKEG